MEPASAMGRLHARLNSLFAAGVFVLSCTVYLLTVAPTVCFWDCGEYVAAGHSLGIPHPPGNPLFVMLSRVADVALFFIPDAGLRLNLISCVSSALMAMLIYLIIVRTCTGWMGVPDAGWKRLVMYVAGTVGALFAAFASTVWFCSVEAEVNAPLLVPITLCTWLVLVWAQSSDERRDRLLVLITYIAYLGIGIHMYSMITLGPLFLYVVIVDPAKLKDWRFWVTGGLMGLVIYDISWFIIAGGLAAAVALLLSLLEPKRRPQWRLCFYLALFGIVGFSSHLYIPVRSALNPMIDENHPASFGAFKGYLERKQYGSESMLSRMFWRRGTWSHQFGIEGAMGFGGFLLTQFFRFSPLDTQKSFIAGGGPAGWGKLLVYLLPLFFIAFGIRFLYTKRRTVAVLLGSLLFMTTAVLVVYMNFADGTRADCRRNYNEWVSHGRRGPAPLVRREVRVRDYFYVAGFAFCGMWIGIAAGGFLYLLYTNRRKFLRTAVAPLCTVFFAASPALPLTQNLPFQTRKGDFIPFDFAYNLLMSCERDGVLFTNGDNDTFPLWALQEAYNVRRDVRIVNLSLLNTRWYIRQLMHRDPAVPVSYTDDQIERLNHSPNPVTRPARYTLPHAGITVDLPSRREHATLRLQDLMVLAVVDAVRWTKPVYLAMTVPDDNLMGLGPYLQMQGLVYRVMAHPVAEAEQLDLGRTLYLLDHVYRYRGLGDGSAPLNETSERLLTNYAASFMEIALMLRKPLADRRAAIAQLEQPAARHPDSASLLVKQKKNHEDTLALALGMLDRCIALVPWDWRPRALRHEFLVADDRLAEAEKAMREALNVQPGNGRYLQLLAQALDLEGKKGTAAGVVRAMVEQGVDTWDTFISAARVYAEAGSFDSAIALVREYAGSHPGDCRAAEAIAQFEQLKNRKGQSP
jgi:hypothetical protein